MATYLDPAAHRGLRVGRRHRAQRLPLAERGAAQRPREDAAVLDTIDEQIDYFDDYFGPYPLDRYGIAITDSGPGLAMETQGRSLFSRDDSSGGRLGYDAAAVPVARARPSVVRRRGLARHGGRTSGSTKRSRPTANGCGCDHVGFATVQEQRRRRRWPSARPAIDGRPDGPRRCSGSTATTGGAVVAARPAPDDRRRRVLHLLRRWVADNNGTSRTTEDFIALAKKVVRSGPHRVLRRLVSRRSVPESFPTPAPTPARHERRLRRW